MRCSFWLRTSPGNNITVQISSIPLRHIDHQWGVVSIWHDITVREQLLETLEYRVAELDATLNAIADGLMITDASGRLLRMNAAADRILKYTEVEQSMTIHERTVAFEVAKDDGSFFEPSETPAMRALQGETVSGEVMVIHRPHGTFWTSVSAAPILAGNGEILGVVVTLTDITSLHELQEEQKTFLHMVSHDLRNPMAIIKGSAQIVQEALGKTSN